MFFHLKISISCKLILNNETETNKNYNLRDNLKLIQLQ